MKLFNLESKTLQASLVHLALIVSITATLLFVLFLKVMPGVTNHGEMLTVPDVSGMTINEAASFLASKGLRYEVGDSSYQSGKVPFAVLDQFPRPLSKVKIDRKIVLRVNAKVPPSVQYPDVEGASLSFARGQLEMLDLVPGTIAYRPDVAHNAVLESRIRGELIRKGQPVPKGTVVDFIVGSQYDGADEGAEPEAISQADGGEL